LSVATTALRTRLLLLLGIALLLQACAGTARKPVDPAAEQAYQQRQAYLQGKQGWRLSGRLAASDGKDGGGGAFTWEQQATSTRMSFRGALGKGAWELEASPGRADLLLADGRRYFAETIAELVTAHMQAKVPVDALSWWVLGLARPGDYIERDLDQHGRITFLRQLGWDVTFSNYRQAGETWLPGKLVARNKENSVKLAISDWSLQPDTKPQD
jgi:outer membrane lipoprotein LolB